MDRTAARTGTGHFFVFLCVPLCVQVCLACCEEGEGWRKGWRKGVVKVRETCGGRYESIDTSVER